MSPGALTPAWRWQMARAFGAALRAHRARLALSQEEFANRAGFDRTFPSLLERGLRTPTLTAFCCVAEALGLSPTQLLT